jgi:hypothetical protein
LTVERPGQRLVVPTMPREQILALIEDGTDAERRIWHDRGHLVPFALLQGAAALDVARALGNWTRGLLSMTIGPWAYALRRRGLIAPAELEALLAIDTTGVPEDPIRTLRR